MTLFEGVVQRNDEIEDDARRAENLVRGVLAGNIFDLGSAQLCIVSRIIGFHLPWNFDVSLTFLLCRKLN
jgi:hypothetical protein